MVVVYGHAFHSKIRYALFNAYNKYFPFFIPNRTNNLQVSKLKNDFLKQLPAYILPLVWNKNSPENKLLESHTKFKKSIYEEFISNYLPAFKCKSKTCPDCKNRHIAVLYLSPKK